MLNPETHDKAGLHQAGSQFFFFNQASICFNVYKSTKTGPIETALTDPLYRQRTQSWNTTKLHLMVIDHLTWGDADQSKA